MIAIGLRASPSEIVYAILKVSKKMQTEIISSSKVVIPKALDLPERLNFIRKTFKDIIFEYSVCCAGIRITEPNAANIDIDRISFEAILQELLCSSTVEKFFVGQISNISSRLNMPREKFKEALGNSQFELVEGWNSYNKNEKEAILVGIASVK